MTKVFYKSKTFWGVMASLVGLVVTVLGKYFGHDVSSYVETAGQLLQVIGIPFTLYGRIDATQPLALKE